VVVLVSVLCAPPNATTVLLTIHPHQQGTGCGFWGPMVLTLFSALGRLLTLIGDLATFLVGSSIGLTFVQYLQKVSLGGLMTILVLIPLMPVALKDVWHVQRTLPADLRPKPLERPILAACSLLVLATMIVLFMVGEWLPTQIVPPAVAIIGASLALLVVYGTRIEPIDNVLKDIDWKTLLFLLCMFCLVEAFTKTGVIQNLSLKFYAWFGVELSGRISVLLWSEVFGPAGQHSAGRRHDPDARYFVVGQLVPEERLWPGLHRLAGVIAAGVRGHDVRRDPGRQRHAHRRIC
jgi:Na+/H+ antiporter NhaD/arsenite permease-like protein